MSDFRIRKHPILQPATREEIEFTWDGKALKAYNGETISTALFANGIRIFGHHHKDKSPQGIFCANGQCSQCLVIADGKPVKACVEPVKNGLCVMPLNSLPRLPELNPSDIPGTKDIKIEDIPVLILGGGPAGLSAATELGKQNIDCIIVDDKHRLGGKLVLQTHRFFGSIEAVHAGTRGIDIATHLENELTGHKSVKIWLNSSVIGVYSDGLVGVWKENLEYRLLRPEVLLVATGARERSLAFPGNTLAGVYGAGAFQTLVNRDLIRPSNRIFIIGGGNVGLIAGYHALQANIQVAGLVEALPECGGYKVHKDKLVRFGVPVYTSHTILSANGQNSVQSVTIAAVDQNFKTIPGTEKSFACDTVLVAVGLEPVNEFYNKAIEFGIKCFIAGDAEEIAEASAAIFSGKIRGREIAGTLGINAEKVPEEWYKTATILKSRPGKTKENPPPETRSGIIPIFHCSQEIPCNPCTSVCPQKSIIIDETDIRNLPIYEYNPDKPCLGCEKCVTICPGLAITLVDYRKNPEYPTVTIAYEFLSESIHKEDEVTVLDAGGSVLGNVKVIDVKSIKNRDRTVMVKVQAPAEYAKRIAGIRYQAPEVTHPIDQYVKRIEDDTIICRCERVTAKEIRQLIKKGFRDINELKTVTRAGMGACGGKTCSSLIHRIFREEGVPDTEVTENTCRPPFVEVPLGVFAGQIKEDDHD